MISHINVQAITYTSAIIGLLGLIVVLTLKNIHYAIKPESLMLVDEAFQVYLYMKVFSIFMVFRPRHFIVSYKVT